IPRTSSRSSFPPVRILPRPTLRVRGPCLKDTHGWRLPYALLRCSTPVLCPGDTTEGHKASDRGYANFYEKALFVKGYVATAPGLTQLLCPSRYASIRTFGELTLSLVARCIMGSTWFGLLRRCCKLPSGLPGGWA